MSKYYAGIGSRKTPQEILKLMTQIARVLEKKGFILRSGGAQGADSAFEAGTHTKEIFRANEATPQAITVAKKFHPAWSRMGEYAQKLHGRNAFQVLGRFLDTPSSFVICWTPDACINGSDRKYETGGTGTAISIASANSIPVFNLANSDHYSRLVKMVKDNNEK